MRILITSILWDKVPLNKRIQAPPSAGSEVKKWMFDRNIPLTHTLHSRFSNSLSCVAQGHISRKDHTYVFKDWVQWELAPEAELSSIRILPHFCLSAEFQGLEYLQKHFMSMWPSTATYKKPFCPSPSAHSFSWAAFLHPDTSQCKGKTAQETWSGWKQTWQGNKVKNCPFSAKLILQIVSQCSHWTRHALPA